MNIEECSEKVKYKNISFKEKRSSIIFFNPDLIEVTKVQVDGCLEIEELKCDWLMIIEKANKDSPHEESIYLEIYIELKGCDVEHAFKQIENTIKFVSKNKEKIRKYCYIITTRCPLTSTEISNNKKEFKKKYNAILRIEKLNHTENINSLMI